MALTWEEEKKEDEGNKKGRVGRGEKKEIGLTCVWADGFFKYFSFPQGNINSLLSTLTLKCVF